MFVIVIVAVAAQFVVVELKAEAQFIANITEGNEVTAANLEDCGKGTRILFFADSEVSGTFQATARIDPPRSS
ncbi:hypothetical protein E5D57_007818 [Metarhizium anisopliae]|nr:hypothetical protein E5D57_007818 [Metarhizium anisopliae]